jgi:hypothetical protein
MLAPPWRDDRLDAMLRASASRDAGDRLPRQPRGAEVPPTSFVGMVGKPAGAAVFRTADAKSVVREPNLDSSLLAPQFRRLNPPGVVAPERCRIMGRKCCHLAALLQWRFETHRPIRRTSPTTITSR